jgi:hypothetical protein
VGYSGSNPLPVSVATVTSITNSVAVVNLDRDGNPSAGWPVYPVATGTNETNANVLRTTIMTDTTVSTVVNSGTLTGITNTLTQQQLSGAADSVSVTSITGPIAQGDAASALRVIIAGNSDTSTVVNSGTLTAITNTLTQQQLSGAVDSVSVTSITGPISQGDSTSALRVVHAGDVATSVFVTGFSDSVTVFQARTTNPTAKSDGADVRPTTDDLGRTLTRPIQVRDLTKTAYVATTTGIETTLFTPTAGTFADLVMLAATNGSTAAITVDVRDSTAGNIVHTMVIPASTGPVGFVPSIPYPQGNSGANWTIDVQGSDVSNTNAYFTALFSQEI